MSAFAVEEAALVCVFVCTDVESGGWRGGGVCRNNGGCSRVCRPAPCLLAVDLISEEKYTLCLHNEDLCLRSASELSTILQIVSSLLKRFQTATVEPASFPVNCLASSALSCASSESRF